MTLPEAARALLAEFRQAREGGRLHPDRRPAFRSVWNQRQLLARELRRANPRPKRTPCPAPAA